MNFEITKGKIKKPYKVVVYGPEGIGKSTFASHFPDPLFIDTDLLDHWILRDFLSQHLMKCSNRRLITSFRIIHLSVEH